MSSLQAIRQAMSEEMGDFFSGTTTGAGDTDTLVDTGLLNLPNGGDDEAFEGWYLKIVDACHCANGESRRIKTYTASTGTCDTESAFSASTGSGTTYELHRYNPDDKDQVINRAVAAVYPYLYRRVLDESLVVDNLLQNADFETFSSGFTNWTEVGSPTVTQETTIVIHGDGAAKVVSDACNDGQLTQAPTININSMTDLNVEFSCWVYATASCVARIRIDFDGTDIESSDYHTGVDEWQLLTVNATIPCSATQVKAICEVESGTSTAYFDGAYLFIDPVYRYTIPSTIVSGPHFVSQQHNLLDPSGPYYPLVNVPTAGRRLRLEGMGTLSTMSSDTATTEVSEPRLELLVAQALTMFARLLWTRSASQDRTRFREDMEFWQGEVDRLIPTHRMPELGAEVQPRGGPQWHTEETDGTRVLVLDRQRGTVESTGFTLL